LITGIVGTIEAYENFSESFISENEQNLDFIDSLQG
jgi:hypothetical protein